MGKSDQSNPPPPSNWYPLMPRLARVAAVGRFSADRTRRNGRSLAALEDEGQRTKELKRQKNYKVWI